MDRIKANSFLDFFETNHSQNSNIVYARLILSVGLLLTIIFNDINVLFRPTEISFESPMCLQYNFFGIFCLLSNKLAIAKLISILLLIFTISGYLPIIGNVFLWYISFSFYSSSLIIDGGDQVTLVLSLLMIPLFISNRDFNIYNKKTFLNKNNANFTLTTISSVFFILIILQIMILYLQAGIAKLYTNEWANGTAMYYWLHTTNLSVTNWVQSFLSPMLKNKYILPLMTWGVMIFEVFLAFSALLPIKYRRISFLLGVCFHFSIVITFGLFSFFFAMTAALFILLRPLKNNQL